MRNTISTTLVLLALTGAAHAADVCEGGPRSEWMTKDDVSARLVELGYGDDYVLAIEDGCIEAKIIRDGKRIEVYFEPVTGEVVKIKS